MSQRLDLAVIESDGQETPLSVDVKQILVAGYTGRDRAKVLEHIEELRHLGVEPPPRVPMVYVLGPDQLSLSPAIHVAGRETSGEAEFFLLRVDDVTYVGVASDHTDRKEEAIDVEHSKLICPHPISSTLWRYADLVDHWDRIEIRSWTTDHAGRRLYQEGHLDAFLGVDDLLREVRDAGHSDLSQRVIYCGTLPTLEGFVYGSRFEAELHDPVLDRTLTCAYEVITA